jgi:hypothetical protein
MNKAIVVLAAMVLVSACGGGNEAASSKATEQKPRESVFDPMVGTMDRAAGVQEYE